MLPNEGEHHLLYQLPEQKQLGRSEKEDNGRETHYDEREHTHYNFVEEW